MKPYTEDSYRSTCRIHIKPALGNVKLSVLSTLQIQRFYNQLLQKGLSPKTIKNVNGVLHKALNQTVKIGELKYNPADACDLPKVYKKEIAPLEQEDIRKFVVAIKGCKFENIYMVTLFTGLRQGEVLGLTWDCVDFARNTILYLTIFLVSFPTLQKCYRSRTASLHKRPLWLHQGRGCRRKRVLARIQHIQQKVTA